MKGDTMQNSMPTPPPGLPSSNAEAMGRYALVIDRLLAEIGLMPEEVRMNIETGFGWRFQRGSAVVEIYLAENNNVGYIQALSPIVYIPEDNQLALFKYLLELNLQLTNAAVGLHGDVIYVFSEREINGLDANEINDLITRVAAYADGLDNQIVEQFGGTLYLDE
jgi:hypothetical protein